MAAQKKSQKRAKRSIILGFVILLGSQAALSLYMHRWAPALVDPGYERRLAAFRQRSAGAGDPLRVIVLGSSRTIYGLDGAAFEKQLSQATGRPVVVCNLGKFGAGPVTNLLYTQRLLADGVRPDLVIVEVIPALLAGQVPLHEIDESRLPPRMLRGDEASLVASYSRGERATPSWHAWLALAAPVYTYRIELLDAMAPTLLRYDSRSISTCDPSGGLEFFLTKPDARLRQAERANWSHFLTEFELGDRPCRAVRETIAKWRAAGVPTSLLLTPEGPEFQSWYAPDDWQQIAAFLDDLKIHEGAEVINARDWLAEDSFADSHHMLPHGGRKFSLRLAESSVVPLTGERWRLAQQSSQAPH